MVKKGERVQTNVTRLREDMRGAVEITSRKNRRLILTHLSSDSETISALGTYTGTFDWDR